MIDTAAVKKARILFESLNSDYIDQLHARKIELGYIFSEPAGSKRSIILGSDGGILYFPASVEVQRAIKAYQDGKRTPAEKFSRQGVTHFLPLQLQAIVHNSRTFAVFFAAVYGVSALFSVWVLIMNSDNAAAAGYLLYCAAMSFFNILCAKNLAADGKDPGVGWLVFTAILALPSIFSIIGILISVSLWSNVAKARKFRKYGSTSFETDDEWRKKNKQPHTLKRQTITAAIVGSVLGLLVWGTFMVSAGIGGSATPTSSSAVVAVEAVSDLKQEMSLPYEVDDVTTLTDVVATGSIIEYQYTIHDADTSGLSSTSLKESTQPGVCDPDGKVRVVLNHGITLSYSYIVRETGERYAFTIDASECS